MGYFASPLRKIVEEIWVFRFFIYIVEDLFAKMFGFSIRLHYLCIEV